MSQYLNFFVKNGEDFVPIGDFSRNTMMYETFGRAPYGHIRSLSREEYLARIQHLNMKIEEHKQAIIAENRTVEFLQNANSKLDERLKVMDTCFESIDYHNEAITEIGEVQSILRIYMTMINPSALGSEIYYGIEVGDPTVADVVS